MTLYDRSRAERERFAQAALTGLLAGGPAAFADPVRLAFEAWKIADACVGEGERRNASPPIPSQPVPQRKNYPAPPETRGTNSSRDKP